MCSCYIVGSPNIVISSLVLHQVVDNSYLTYREVMMGYRIELKKLAEKVTEAMDVHLGLEKGYVKKAFSGNGRHFSPSLAAKWAPTHHVRTLILWTAFVHTPMPSVSSTGYGWVHARSIWFAHKLHLKFKGWPAIYRICRDLKACVDG